MQKIPMLTLVLGISACAGRPQGSAVQNDNGVMSAFASAGLMYKFGSVPTLDDLSPANILIGRTTFSTSPDAIIPLASVFYVDANTQNLYYDGVFYKGVVLTWSISDFEANIQPVINAGKLAPLTLNTDGTAYHGGLIGQVDGAFRVMTDNQNYRYLVQARTCIAVAGCRLPDGQGHVQTFATGEIYSYTSFTLPVPAPQTVPQPPEQPPVAPVAPVAPVPPA